MHWLSSLLNYFYACDVSSEKNLMFFFVRKAVEDRWEVVHSNSTLLFYLWVFPQHRDYSMSCVILRYASYLWYQRLQQLFSQTKAQGVKNSVLRLWFCWWIHKYTNKQISVSVSAHVFSFAHRLMCICFVRKVVLLVNTQMHITKWPEFYLCICKFLFVAQINVPRGTSICATNRNLQIHK